MTKKQLLFWLFVSAISVTLLENMVASVREEKVWEPAREPKTREAAEKLEKESKIREQDAQKKLEEAQKANDTEEVKKEEIKVNQAKFDLDTAQKKITYETLLNDPKVTPEERNKAKDALEAKKQVIEQKIQAIEADLKKGGTDIGGGNKKVTQYEDNFTTKFDPLNEKQKIEQLKKEIGAFTLGEVSAVANDVGRNFDNATRKDILLFLEKSLSPYVKTGGSEVSNLMNSIVETLDEIGKLPKTVISNNAIAKEYNLPEKINADQVKILKKLLTKALFEKTYKTPTEKFNALNEMRQIIDVYGITDKVLISTLNESLLSPSVVEYRIKDAKTLEQKNVIISDVLKTARFQSIEKPEQYSREADLLKNLVIGVGQLGLEFAPVVAAMNERLKEINDFKPDQKPRLETELGKNLKLTDKIPSDKIAVLQAEVGKVIAEYNELIKTDKNQAIKNSDQALSDIKLTMERYSLMDGKYKELYDKISQDLINFRTAVPVELPRNVSQEDVGVVDSLLKGTLDQGTKLLVMGLDAMQSGVDYAIKKEIQVLDLGSSALKNTGQALENYGNMFEKVPKSVANSIDLIETIQDNSIVQNFTEGGAIRQVALVVDKKVVDAVDKELVSAQNTKELLQSNLLQKVIKGVGVIGDKVKQAGTSLKGLSDVVSDQNEILKKDVAGLSTDLGKEYAEKIAVRQNLERALQRVREERLAPQTDNVIKKSIKDKITIFFKDLGESIKNIFSKPKGIAERLSSASQNYEQARADYMNLLGIAPNATQEVIQRAIQENSDKAQQKNFEKRLLTAAQDYAGTVKEYADVLEGVKTSVKFILDAPDSILVPNDFDKDLLAKGKLAENINAIFDIRQQRLNYIAAIQRESESALSDMKQITIKTPVAGITDRMVESISRLIEGSYLSDLGRIAEQNSTLENELINQQEVLKKKLPKVPDEISSSGGTTGDDTDGPKPAGDNGDGDGTYG